jgi:hypothetical protein
MIVVVVCLNLSCIGGQSTPAASSSATSQACAWPTLIRVATSNVGLPDAAASYWIHSFKVYSNLRIILAGRYADARYASIGVYTSGEAST